MIHVQQATEEEKKIRDEGKYLSSNCQWKCPAKKRDTLNVCECKHNVYFPTIFNLDLKKKKKSSREKRNEN